MKVSYCDIYNTLINLIDPERFGNIKEVIEFLKDRPDQYTEIERSFDGYSIQSNVNIDRNISIKFSTIGETLEAIYRNDHSFQHIENVPEFLELLQYMSREISIDR